MALATPCQDQLLTVAALRTAIGHFEPDELAEVKLALERASMEREDFRQGYSPAFAASSPAEVSNLTLRRRAKLLQEEACDHHEILKSCALEAHGVASFTHPAATLQNIRALTEDFISYDGGESSESDEAPADPEADAPFRHVFLVGDRVRVLFDVPFPELRGVIGTVTQNDADVTVLFDVPFPVIAGVPWQMFTQSPQNFEHFRG